MRRVLALVFAAFLALALAGCGGSSSGSSGSSTTPKVIEVTFSGDSVTPNGDRVQVSVGQPIELKVTADAPGEIHVHSSPEQELSYDKGTSTVDLQPIDKPGIVEVESHALDKTIVQLEVR
ncbi:hypothetical protein [Nocardioides panaciterrulae]|uniref:ABC-type oligopeptide transport system substrate-binding subunit n=1 Tax=Nocardioides panaciterrulae TaxID=661492 RepID=A0A7Y9E806_9ACTN|nr:hypothetical protein [Nocardioides panaciterrulae]NYD42798.1 ABC-type oligopeptide transport system substrate-binding subunit [Nocardioides panaciterrulae]